MNWTFRKVIAVLHRTVELAEILVHVIEDNFVKSKTCLREILVLQTCNENIPQPRTHILRLNSLI
jgi:hypothetical protein